LIFLKNYDIIYVENKIKELKTMRIGNDLIGKYHGIPVYKSNIVDYVTYRRYYDQENMYLIDGELIYKNEIFAKYDGNYVTEYDPHKRATYYTIPAVKVDKRGVEFTSSIGADEGDSNSNSETKTPEVETTSEFEFKTVDEILAGSFGSFATEMTDIDAFLKSNS
jgi:hypothetical protein